MKRGRTKTPLEGGPENAYPIQDEPIRNILKKAIYKDFFIYVLKGISMYAYRSRKESRADPQVDAFVAEALGSVVSEEPLSIDDLQRMIERALEMRARAQEMYEGAVGPEARDRESFSGPATMPFFSDKETIPSQARGLGVRKLSGSRAREDYYWEDACVDKLGSLGAMVASLGRKAVDSDVHGLLHAGLDCLSRDPRAFELIALYDKIEKGKMRFATFMAAGDTLVEMPASCRETVARLRGKAGAVANKVYPNRSPRG